MTMINPPPPHRISEKNRCGGGYVGLMGRLEEAGGYEYCSIGSGLFVGSMAEDESRTESVNEEGSSSKGAVVVAQGQDDHEMRDQGWLQLGLGPIGASGQDRARPTRSITQQTGLVELDLLPTGGGLQQAMTTSSSPAAATAAMHLHSNASRSFVWQYPGGGNSAPVSPLHHHQKANNNNNWGFRPQNLSQQEIVMPFSATGSTSTFLMPGGPSYLSRPFPGHGGGGVEVGGGGGGGGVGSSSGFTVIDPPRRHHSGLWFVLQVSQNQSKEPFLPQIPKSYLRIKDGRMTVRLLMKYLVNKLKLDSESEVEIRCRGQQLLPFLTLQHVRDHIWRSSSDATTITLLPDSSTSDHVMVLNYARNP